MILGLKYLILYCFFLVTNYSLYEKTDRDICLNINCISQDTLKKETNKAIFPGEQWEVATPESQGVNAAKLQEAIQFLEENSGFSGDRKWPDAPRGTFAAWGHNNNNIFIIPEWDMVVVRLGLDQSDKEITDKINSEFIKKIGESIN